MGQKCDLVIQLPAGTRTVGNALDIFPKQVNFKSTVENSADKPKNPKRYPYWIIILTRSVVVSRKGIVPQTEIVNRWEMAWTRKWALDYARQLESQGWTVVDIVGGTKGHISHKYGGL